MSSFKRRTPAPTSNGACTTPVPGSRVSAYNGSALVSTGVASVDDVLGGGCPLGSIMLVEEDQDTSYANLLLKYWIAQGLCCPGQQVVVAGSSLDQSPEEIVTRLPYSDDVVASTSSSKSSSNKQSGVSADITGDANHTDDEDDNLASSSASKESMKIAFRYESMKKYETSVKVPNSTSSPNGVEPIYCSVFDLTKTLELDESSQSRVHCFDCEQAEEDRYEATLSHITNKLRENTIEPSASASQQGVRIAIQSLASPAWGDGDSTTVYRFLLKLKSLLREYNSRAAAMVTLPAHLMRNMHNGPAQLRRLEWLCDTVIELESFAGSPSLQQIFPAYSGFLHVHRLPTPNSLLPPSAKLSVLRGLAPGSNSTSAGAGGMDNNLGFKLKRRRGLVIETLHLDEGGGTSERRTTPAQSVAADDQTTPTPVTRSKQAENTLDTGTEKLTSALPKKKLEKRRIRFDDDPSENPSGILGLKPSSSKDAQPNQLKSGLRTDKPELYDF